MNESTATVEPQLYLLPLLAVQWRVPLPDEVKHDRAKAAEYTLQVARERGWRACLVWDSRWTFWVWFSKARTRAHSDGEARPEFEGGWVETTPDRANVPHARVRGRPVTLIFE